MQQQCGISQYLSYTKHREVLYGCMKLPGLVWGLLAGQNVIPLSFWVGTDYLLILDQFSQSFRSFRKYITIERMGL
jgi:hypothetical protein